MHDLEFADAVRPGPIVLLRLPLRPFSVGHEILLCRQRNGLVLGRGFFDEAPPEEQRAWLIRACLVCYRGWAENHASEKHLRFWTWLIRGTDWAAAVAEFRIYREEGSTFPPAPAQEDYEIAAGLQNEQPGRELGGSYLARLIGYLSEGGRYEALGFESPFDVPLGLAQHIYFSALEADGGYRILNAKELQVNREMREHRAAVAEEAKIRMTNDECRKNDETPITNQGTTSRLDSSGQLATPGSDKGGDKGGTGGTCQH